MSSLVLQIGGCGNRLGRAYFDALARDVAGVVRGPEALQQADDRHFFVDKDGTVYANAVLLGKDNRALNSVLRCEEGSGRLWRYGDAQYAAAPTAGDNFGAAYNAHTETELSAIMNVVRQQAERSARLEGLLVLLSLAGGTGSGLGSKVVEAFRDAYPSCTIIAASVWPFSTWENPVHAYNSVLGLSHLQAAADAILLLSNATLLEIAEKRQRPRRATLHDMNSAGARQLACLLRPCHDTMGHELDIGNITSELRCAGNLKYFSLLHEPWLTTSYDSFRWRGLAKSLRRSHLSAGPGGEPMPCVAALTVARGEGVASMDPTDIQLDGVELQTTWRNGSRFLDDEKTLMLVSNGHACLPHLSQAARDASRTYSAKKAFFHQYRSHGVEDDVINKAIDSIEDTLGAYGYQCRQEELNMAQACGDPPRKVLRGRPAATVPRGRQPNRR